MPTRCQLAEEKGVSGHWNRCKNYVYRTCIKQSVQEDSPITQQYCVLYTVPKIILILHLKKPRQSRQRMQQYIYITNNLIFLSYIPKYYIFICRSSFQKMYKYTRTIYVHTLHQYTLYIQYLYALQSTIQYIYEQCTVQYTVFMPISLKLIFII